MHGLLCVFALEKVIDHTALAEGLDSSANSAPLPPIAPSQEDVGFPPGQGPRVGRT